MAIIYKLISAQGNAINVRSPNQPSVGAASAVPNLKCPHCMHMGAFTAILGNDLGIVHQEMQGRSGVLKGNSTVGIRICPNQECRGVVLVVIDGQGRVVVLPNEVLDFDAANIPAAISSSMEEAIKCHSAQCYKAAALMVRRVLEELCEDRGAAGGSLKERIAALSRVLVIPSDLLQAADHLRLLGNDAAHIEAKTYQAIGPTEIKLAIDLTKELLKAAYQYKGLLGQLTALQG